MTHPLIGGARAPHTHTLTTGRTGMGKSTLLGALCRERIAEDQGLLLVDPHGDLAARVRADVPRYRKNDLIVLRTGRPKGGS
jgi:type IV secretory pathway VirB4 component